MAPTCAGAYVSGTVIAGANVSGTVVVASAGPNDFKQGATRRP